MNTFIMESSVVRPATNPYGRLDRNSVVGYEGEHNSRSLVVETTDDLSAYASVSLIIDDLDCGAMTKTTSGSKTVLSLTLTSAMIGASGRKLCQLLMVDSNNTVIAKSSQFVILIKRSNDIERSVEDGVSFIIISEAVTEMAQEAASAAAQEAVADVVADCQAIADDASASADAAAQSASDAQSAAESIVVDSALDATSTHALQNKVVTSEINALKADLGAYEGEYTTAELTYINALRINSERTAFVGASNYELYCLEVNAGDMVEFSVENGTAHTQGCALAWASTLPASGVLCTFFEQVSIPAYSTETFKVKISKNGYAVIAYYKTTFTITAKVSTQNVLAHVQAIEDGMSVYSDENEYVRTELLNIYKTGSPSVRILGEFDHYGLNQQGEFLLSQAYRVSSGTKISFAEDVTFSVVKSGFRFGYDSFDGSTVTWHGWYTTSVTIPANTQFKLQIARTTEVTSEVANVDEFLSAISFGAWSDKYFPLTDGDYYFGDMKPSKNKYTITAITQLSKINGISYAQGLAINNGVLAVIYNTGAICIYDLDSKTVLGQYMLDIADSSMHGNSADFSNTAGTTYPLVYISECYGNHRCFVEDITNTESTLIQTIAYANDIGSYDGNSWDWILDKDNGHIMTYGKHGTKHLVKVFPLPLTTDGDITFQDADKLDEWCPDDAAGELINIYQGHSVYGNILYLLASQDERILAFDVINHTLLGKINLTADHNFSEIEDVDVYNGSLIIVTVNRGIHQIRF